MVKYIKRALFGIGLSFIALSGGAEEAKANNYCREYTRSVYIGNSTQEAYGTACLQPNGDWMIVGEGLGGNVPYSGNNVNYAIRDNNRYITPPRVVYYDRAPQYNYHPSPMFVWDSGGHNRGNTHYNNNRRWDNGHGNRNRGSSHGRQH